jgi:Ca2+-binding EF-hand superfamily protein
MNFYKYSLILALLLFFTACNRPDLSPELLDWEDYKDKRIEQEEFNKLLSASEAYDLWDANDDTYLNREEFYNGYFNLWDRNNSGAIESVEWHHQKLPQNEALEPLPDKFSAWDTDDNGHLTPGELKEPLQEVNYFAYLDDNENDRLSHQEISGAMFELLDHNDNGYAEREEYDIWLETELDDDEEVDLPDDTEF